MKSLLQGVRVLAVEQYGAGPFGTLHLADLGADVIKVESPRGGDYARGIPPYSRGTDSLFFQALNRNKRSIALDLSGEPGREVLGRLVAGSDAVLTNLRGGAATRLGLRYDVLGRFNPRIVCCFLTGFGLDGDRHDEPGFDYLLQAESGIMSLAGDPDGPPVKAGVSVIDFSTGIASALALLAGVVSARETGRGGDVEVSLQDTAASLLNYVATWYLTEGYETPRLADSAHPSLVPSQLFDCQDGALVLMVNRESFWAPLTEVVGHPEWADAADRSKFEARLANRESVVADLQAVFRTNTAEYWLARLAEHGVPAGPVRSVGEAFSSPEYLDRTVGFDHPQFGTVRSPGPLVRPARTAPTTPAPPLGAHTDEILATVAGMPSTEIDDLRSSGVI